MLDLFVLLALDLLGLLLLEQYLVFVVDLRFSKALISLFSDLVKSLIESDFFRIVELLQIGQLLL